MQQLRSRTEHSIGSYLGVPLHQASGALYGTLCVLDPEPRRFSSEGLDVLMIVAGWLRLYLAREEREDDHA